MFLFQCSYHTIFSTKCKRQIALPNIQNPAEYRRFLGYYAKNVLSAKFH